MSTQTLAVSDTFDVFVSYSLLERSTAELVERALQESGLRTSSQANFELAADWQDQLWQALVESDAVVVVLDPSRPMPANIGVEIGAALARHKPLYAVVARANFSSAGTETEQFALPAFMHRIRSYSVATIDDLVRTIKRSLKPLSDEERADLIAIYSEQRVPADQLLQEQTATDRLAREFETRTGRDLSGDRLVQELIRLRKSGKLPRIRK